MKNLKAVFKRSTSDRGFVLPIVLTMGLMMVLVGVTAVARSQSTRLNSFSRNQTAGGSLVIAEGGIARTLAQLTKANNRVLLTGNFDTINPRTGKTYLGADGILNNGDEENTPVNQWASVSAVSSCSIGSSPGTPDITYDGIVGDSGTYALKAYRHHNASGTGTLLVEGKRKTSVSLLKVIVEVDSVAGDFPGVTALETMELRGRDVIGSNGNVYYDPAFSNDSSLTASSARGDANRSNYLNAIKSGPIDDGDNVDDVEGKIVACKLKPTFSYTPQGTNLGDLNKNLKLSGSSSGITHYQVNKIALDSKVVDVDTTAGAVYLYVVSGDVSVTGKGILRNIRTDGTPPRVGDLRIVVSTDKQIQIDDDACIQTAFLYAPQGSFKLNGVSNGCPNHDNTNIDGVVWAKEIINTSNNDPGVAVPDDVSSLSDITNNIGLPTTNKLGTVKSWQRQQQQ